MRGFSREPTRALECSRLRATLRVMSELSGRLAPSLYVHVPFCAQKCHYCAFYSTAANGDLVQRYVEVLAAELTTLAERLQSPPRTIFFGGGTPSLLNLRQWETLLTAAARAGLTRAAEWSVECNPATVSLDKARLLRDHGVNRISMGVQSLDEALLDRLGRVHSRDMVFRSFEILRRAGFDNLNVDLMFGIPGQTMEIWQSTLREACQLGSEHLSSYEVIFEEDTPLFEQLQAGRCDIDEELTAAMYQELIEASGHAGFRQYEVANFARDERVRETAESAAAATAAATAAPAVPEDGADPDPLIPAFACRHNVNYWRGGDYVAVGPSACGYEGGVRYRNLANTTRYCEAREAAESTYDWSEQLPPLARAGEIAAFGLRMNAGWRWRDFTAVTGKDLRVEWAAELQDLVARGWAVLEATRFRLTPQGMRFADAAGSEFLRPIGEAEIISGPNRDAQLVGGAKAAVAWR